MTLQDGVGRCPRCKGTVAFVAPASIASPDKEAWTDGWTGRDDDWVRCPQCEATMPAAEMKTGKVPKAAAGDPAFKDAPALLVPNAEQVQAALWQYLERVAEGSEEESRARLALWRSTNHARRDESPAQPFSEAEERNLQRLGVLLGAFNARASAIPTKGLLRIEVLRELGRFAAAKAALRRARAEIEHLEELVDAGDRRVRRRSPRSARPWDGYPDEIAADMRAAEAGDGEAALRVSHRFESGEGVPADHAAAADWMKRAIKGGSNTALSNAGITELKAGDLHFGAALAKLLPAVRAGDAEAGRAIGIGADLPPECARGIIFLGERGTPDAAQLLLAYLEAARASGEAAPEMAKRIQAALNQLVERLGKDLGEANLEACRKELAATA
jgi:TPR repeat protein